jgi:hypothetical protein
MGKLKETLLNNHNEDVNPFELSAFEYVEYMSNYKDNQDEYIPTDEELEKLNQMLEEYYKSKEFRDYVENYQPVGESLTELEDEFFGKWTSADIDAALAEHNAHEEGFDLDSINNSMNLKYTDEDILNILQDCVDAHKVEFIMGELNKLWNQKNGFDL